MQNSFLYKNKGEKNAICKFAQKLFRTIVFLNNSYYASQEKNLANLEMLTWQGNRFSNNLAT